MGYRGIKAAVGPAMEMLYQPWIRGEENIPAEGAAILASNHLAVIDSFFLPLLVDREVAFIGKSDYFTGRGVKGWAVKNFMTAVGTIPVDRSGGKASQAALQAGIDRLRSGELFGIYPEGTRSPDGRLYRGKTGVARVTLATGAPVIPVAMIGSNLAQPIGQVVPSTRHRVGIVIGEPLDFSRYQGLENDRFVLRSITDEIMYALMSLSGQEYVDLYAADVKKAMDAEKKTAAEVVEEMLEELAAKRPSAAPVEAPGGRPAPDVEVPEPPEEPEDAEEEDAEDTEGAPEGDEGFEPDAESRSDGD
ncbi:lysophospholipid acyltransferase family protein [Actinomyces qiguomingii]|uniref:lysophospholipid acyltransferase family protein n=1 Tax=Actinomyces qiguomingii TaxID=2057800 RepID=UPI000CA00F09|nr:lysophospholipid acyltransferase family protein [Actinomyces qiguomingii]